MSPFKTSHEAQALLPATAKWSSSFGNPGSPGFHEYYRTPDGSRFCISNGPFGDEWSLSQLACPRCGSVTHLSGTCRES